MNIEEFLGTNKELYLLRSQYFIGETLKVNTSIRTNAILFFHNIEERELTIVSSNMNKLIKESAESEDYVNNLFTKLKLTKKGEDKLLALISLGFELKEAVYSPFIQGKENEFKWESYRDYSDN